MSNFNFKYSFAFTMAEAVLVMTILGIIATVMITTMKPAKFKDRALKIRATKVVNNIDEATNMILLNHSKDGTIEHIVAEDGSEINICGSYSKENSDKLANLYKKYLQASRTPCTDSSCICYKQALEFYDEFPYMSFFNLKDGACIAIAIFPKGKMPGMFPGDTLINENEVPLLKNVCGIIGIDINSSENPNTLSKDQYILRFSKDGLAWDSEVDENETFQL